MDRKRPQGREKNVTGSAGKVFRRGQGLGTGPVGGNNGTNPVNPQNNNPRPVSGSNQPAYQNGGTYPQRASGLGSKGSLIKIIIIVAVVIIGAKYGLGGLFGGGGSSSYSENAAGNNTGYENIFGSITGGSGGISDSFFGGGTTTSSPSSSSGSVLPSSTSALDRTVAAGSREKYTKILGGGQDKVTIMVYLCGTDLESKSGMATRDLIEMTNATLSNNLRIVVYTGGCTKWNNEYISANVNQIYEVVSGGIRCVNQNAGTGAMTDPATLTSFIKWCAQNYGANRNELILWDHGGGSVSGYGYDQKNARSGSMTLAGINTALKNAGMKFDFIGFDACLMATVETGLMLSDYADYMIASEETEPGIGWYYTNWLTSFAANTSMPTIEVGQKIIDDFVTTCNSQCRGQSATLSIVDLAELSNTAPGSLKSFAQSISTLIKNDDYKAVSSARNGSREFAQSTMIDQIDLVHFANLLGNSEGEALSKALLGAVKYNRTSSNMTSAYGISIYFPYRKASKVDAAVSTYNAIGLDSSYSQCIREFASLEVSGQVASGGTTTALPSLLGSLSGGSSGDTDMISSLLGGFLGGDFGSISGLTGSNTSFFSDRELSNDQTVAYLAKNYFDPQNLRWTTNKNGDAVISMPEEQWNLIESLEVNMFYDDGEGYIDLGLDTTFSFDEDGNLLAGDDQSWLGVNGQVVAFYHEYTTGSGSEAVTTGRIPALLNGERVDLLVVFDSETPNGRITGARPVYDEETTETVAKSLIQIEDGDTIDFLCDYYTYDGEYEDSYYLGNALTVNGELKLSNLSFGRGEVRFTYRFTDIYQQHYWTLPREN